jgi:hypothetical protein
MTPPLRRFSGHQRPVNNLRGRQEATNTQTSARAAHTVSSLSKSTGLLKTQDLESFEQLLREILHAGEDGAGDGYAIETNLATNYNLISVVTRVGLEVLVQDNPFADTDHLLSVAERSLSALTIVIGKLPGILFADPASILQTDVIQPPLFVWLLSRLLALFGRPQLEGLHEGLAEVIRAVVRAAASSTKPSSDFAKVLSYLKSCITGSYRPSLPACGRRMLNGNSAYLRSGESVPGGLRVSGLSPSRRHSYRVET